MTVWLIVALAVLLAAQFGSAYLARYWYRGRPAEPHPRRPPTRSASTTSDKPAEDVRQAVLASFEDANATVVPTSTPGAVRGFTKFGWRTYGSMITVWVSEVAGSTSIAIECTTATPTQLFDWGESETNLQKVLQGITRRLGPTTAGPPPPPPPAPGQG